MKKKHLLLIFLQVLLSNFLFAQTWNGSTSTDWNTPGNWTPEGVPTTTGNVVIPGSLTNYPELASNVTIRSINMTVGSKLDFNGRTLDIESGANHNYFIGATLNNSDDKTDIVINLNTGTKKYASNFSNTTVNDNVIFNLSGINSFKGADGKSSENIYTGNVTFNVKDAVALNLSNGSASRFQGDLTVSRTITGGSTKLFSAGGTITGNFKFTNNIDGDLLLGSLNNTTNINGKVDIILKPTTPALCVINGLKNKTNGGIINVQNSFGFDVRQDTLMVDSLNITDYIGGWAYLFNNYITGNLTLAYDRKVDLSNTSLRSNIITGNASFTTSENGQFIDGPISNSGSYYKGNVSYSYTTERYGALGSIVIGYGDTTSFGGSVSLNGINVVLNKVQFVGKNNGILQNTGNNPIVVYTMIMNKSGTSRITLKNPVRVTTNLSLISGIIESGVNSNFELMDNIRYRGGSDSSYIEGPMVKTGNHAFTFPIGYNNKYAPLTISAPGAATDQFRAQYVAGEPHNAGYDSTKKEVALKQISFSEYWLLDRITGTSDVSVKLSWSDKRSGVIDDLKTLRVAHWNDNKWENLGNANITGDHLNGSIQTEAVVTSFSPFTLASTSRMNPLPINISKFDAFKNTRSVSLKWISDNEINFSHFEIERAGSDNHFNAIGKVTANNELSTQHYSFEDMHPLKGVNLYRLKLLDRDGKTMYSEVILVTFNDKGMITIYPNPATDYILIDGVQQGVSIEINDASGKLVKRMLSNASNIYSVKGLRTGMYFIKILDKENTKVTKLIIR